MTEYYLFLKNRLFQATVVALLLPFFVFLIATISTLLFYDFSLPITYLAISSTPLLFLCIRVQLTTHQNILSVKRKLFGLTLMSKEFYFSDNETVQWQKSTVNNRQFTLFIGVRSTNINVHQ